MTRPCSMPVHHVAGVLVVLLVSMVEDADLHAVGGVGGLRPARDGHRNHVLVSSEPLSQVCVRTGCVLGHGKRLTMRLSPTQAIYATLSAGGGGVGVCI